MSKKSDDFEKKITRIKQILEQGKSLVKWNDKLPDPDNIKQPRQIDISIKKDEKITHVECRIHKTPQNVKWIEELIGRKISLGVDSMIAVSASGFTSGAKKKAKAKGIIIRDLSQVSIQEAESWGEKSDIKIEWLTIKDIEMNFIFPKKNLEKVSLLYIEQWIIQNKDVVYVMIKHIADYTTKENIKKSIKVDFTEADEFIKFGIKRIEIKANLKFVQTIEDVVYFYSYGNPNNEKLNSRTTVEENHTRSIELINTKGSAGITLDLSKISIPTNHFFKSVNWIAKRSGQGLTIYLNSIFESKFTTENMKVSFSIE
ncbi:restriction endonuclease [Formosa sp. PL04]|uniref:restriction endonuclease n=1 Tax=Formosa sp. PL04 TaxID=3081755 RepID=UPI002981AD9A|nr:restriction endonuclease [Formosa sp. PL04]MDW5290370.1 restriction endonuclease [Formosa sp. PL04]